MLNLRFADDESHKLPRISLEEFEEAAKDATKQDDELYKLMRRLDINGADRWMGEQSKGKKLVKILELYRPTMFGVLLKASMG